MYDFVSSTPVIEVTASGMDFMMARTSSVNLEAPTSPDPSEIIVILLVRDKGAAISAAIFGITCSIMST
jgi:hypothetical protein